MNEWSDWESGDCVAITNSGEDIPGRPQREILQRVAEAFRRVIIDWTEGERYAEARIAAMVEVGMPKGLLELDEKLFRGHTVLMSVADAAGSDAAWVRFLMSVNTASFDLHYEPPGALETCRELGRKLAEALGYVFVTNEDALAEVDPPSSDTLMHRDLWPSAEGRLPTPKGCLPTDELLQRVANRFPLAIIDRECQPGSHGQFARVAHVTIRDAVGGPQFCFFLIANPTIIQIEYERPEDRKSCRPLLEALVAELADYYHVTQDSDNDDESEDLDD
jgi:hypothetical protein